MASTGLRERKKARTRQALEDAALELFTTKGFDATTIEEIVAAVEFSPRTFFRYFASKEDVLFGRDTRRERELAEFLASRPAAETPLEKLRAMLAAQAAYYEQDRDRLLAHVHALTSTPSLRAAAAAHQRTQEEVVVATLVAADPNADAREIRFVVAVCFAGLRASLENWLAAGADEDLPALAVEALDRLARGLDQPHNAKRRARGAPAAK